MAEPTGNDSQQIEDLQDWRIVDGSRSAWFSASSQAAAASLLERAADLAPDAPLPTADLRSTGLRLTLSGTSTGDTERARGISAAAAELGLIAEPAALQSMRAAFATSDAGQAVPFWQQVLNYSSDGDGELSDPLRRDPRFTFGHLAETPMHRNRIHVDVVRPGEAVENVRTALDLQPAGPYGVMLADADGNEIDLVPGEKLSTGSDTADWWAVFAGMAFYPTDTAALSRRLVAAVADLADSAGIPLLIDVRPNGVILDSGKDQWEADNGPRQGFLDLADRISAAAADLGLSADPIPLRFVQFGIDAVDVAATRAFWAATLGYELDPRPQVTDIYDPRRLNPVLFFQPMDADAERLRQPDRIHLELAVPVEVLAERVAAATAAGGQLVEQTHGRCSITDPSGNRLDIVAG